MTYIINYTGTDANLNLEFQRISEAIYGLNNFAVPTATRVPVDAKEGSVRLADGVNWDPLGTGTISLVIKQGTEWIEIGAGAGAEILGENVGTGVEVYKEKVNDTLRFRRLQAGNNLTITQNEDDILIGIDNSITPVIPGDPSNLVTTSIWGAVVLNWSVPTDDYLYTEIWRSSTNDRSTATLIQTSIVGYYADYLVETTAQYYWIRFVSETINYSNYFPNTTAGIQGIPGTNAGFLLGTLTGLITETELNSGLDSRIDEIDQGANSILNRLTSNTTDILTNANSLGLLNTRVGTVEGISSANTSAIQNLESSVGALDSSGGQEWQFNSDLESWTSGSSTLTGPVNGIITFTPTGNNPSISSPTFDQSGSVFSQIVMRIRQVTSGGTWEGNAYYVTSSHGVVNNFRKAIANPNFILNEWQVLTWDMADLTNGGDDWVNSDIEQIRLDLVSDAGGAFEIDWILVAKFSTTAISDAISLLDTRVTDNTNDINSNEMEISAESSRVDLLNSSVTSIQTQTNSNASAISGLTTRVTSIEGINTSQSADITSLQVTVNNASTGVVATATALQALQTDVTQAESDIQVNATSLSTLTATVNNQSASINTLSSVQVTQQNDITNLEARYGVRLDVNGYVTGFTQNNDGTESNFEIITDNFRLIDPVGGSSQTGLVPFAYSNGVVAMQNVVIGNALIQDLTVDKLTTGILGADVRIGGGRLIYDNGTVMKIEGLGFGSSNQFIEWFGPSFSDFALCTESNAISYKTITGDAYFGGSLSAGVLYNAATGTEVGTNISAEIGPFGTNGGSKVIVVSYRLVYDFTLTGDQTGATVTPNATVRLRRQFPIFSNLSTFNVTGTENRNYEIELNTTFVAGNMSGSQTITDTLSSTSNFTYEADLSSRTVSASDSFINEQSLTITSTEE